MNTPFVFSGDKLFNYSPGTQYPWAFGIHFMWSAQVGEGKSMTYPKGTVYEL